MDKLSYFQSLIYKNKLQLCKKKLSGARILSQYVWKLINKIKQLFNYLGNSNK